MITTVVGNYPKLSASPQAPSLRRAISQFDTGKINQEQLNGVADDVTRDAIQEQIDAGLDLITDGQIRWDDGQTYLARGIKGFATSGLLRYFDTNTYYRQPVPETKLEWTGPITVNDFKFAQHISSVSVKPVITGPFTLGYLSQQGCYDDMSTLVLDLAQILNREALALEEAGATIIQFDEPAFLRHKQDFSLLKEASSVVTHGLQAKTSIYTYFGDVSGIHQQFFQLPFQVFGLDFVMGKGNYELIKDLPPEKELGAGIIDARNTKMETVNELVESIRNITRHVSPDRVYLNPSAGLEFLPRARALAKLERLVKGAKKAKEDLI